MLYYFMFWLYFEENKFICRFLFLVLSIYINKMTYQLLHGTNAVNFPRKAGFDTTELVSLFKLRSDSLHIRYKLDDEWKSQYPLSCCDFDLTQLSNVDKIYVVGDSDNCIIPPVPTSSLPNYFTRSNCPLESATNQSNFHLQHINKRGNTALHNLDLQSLFRNTFGSLGPKATPRLKKLKASKSRLVIIHFIKPSYKIQNP